MTEWIALYPQLKSTHIALAVTSVGLFVLRAAGVLAGARWPLHRAARIASVCIDTLLFCAGVALWAMLSLHLGRDHWLFVKLVLIVAYIVLGSLALKRAPTRLSKAVAFVVALACIGSAATIAVRHDPWGPLRAFVAGG